MTSLAACPSCSGPMPGGRFNACPTCGHDLTSSTPNAAKYSATQPTASHPNTSQGQPHQSWTQPNNNGYANITLHSKSIALGKKANLCWRLLISMVAIRGITVIVPALWSLWSLSQLRDLVSEHGWGYVPAGRLESALEPEWLFILQIGGIIAAAILLLLLIFEATRALRDAGISGLKWSPKWTTLSLLLPFVNLYRPWAGLNELERTLSTAADICQQSRIRAENLIADRSFSIITPIYAITVFMLIFPEKLAQQVLKDIERVSATSQISFYNNINTLEWTMIILLIAVAIEVAANLLYWGRITKKMTSVTKIISD